MKVGSDRETVGKVDRRKYQAHKQKWEADLSKDHCMLLVRKSFISTLK